MLVPLQVFLMISVGQRDDREGVGGESLKSERKIFQYVCYLCYDAIIN